MKLFGIFISIIGIWFSACIDIYSWGRDNPCDRVNGGCEADSGLDAVEDGYSEPDTDAFVIDIIDDSLLDVLDGDLISPDIPPDCESSCTPPYFLCENEGGDSSSSYEKCDIDDNGCFSIQINSCFQDFRCLYNVNMCVGQEFEINMASSLSSTALGIDQIDGSHFAIVWVTTAQAGQSSLAGRVFDSNGAGAESLFVISANSTEIFIAPLVSRLDNNKFLIVWTANFGPTNKDIYGHFVTNTGNLIGTRFLINSTTTNLQSSPQVGVFDASRFAVVWASMDQDGDNYGIYGQIFDSNGGHRGDEFQINSYTNNEQSSPKLSILDATRFVVVWNSDGQDKSYMGVFGRILDSRGQPLFSEFQVNTDTMKYQLVSIVQAIDEERFAVLWINYVDDIPSKELQGRIFNQKGEPLSSEFRINQTNYHYVSNAKLALIDGTRLVMAWQLNDTNNPNHPPIGIFGRVFDSNGNSLSSEFKVNAYTTNFQESPQLQVLDSGHFVIVWSALGQGQSDFEIFGRFYNSHGDPIGSEFQINIDTAHYQEFPMIESFGLNRFVVIWEMGPTENSPQEILGRVFYQ